MLLHDNQCQYLKGYNSLHIFLVMPKKNSKNQIHKGNAFGALLTCVLNVFDCIDQLL